jgi:type IV pilus assembly protein PilN
LAATSAQDAKNDFLKKEIAVLDKEIDQIKRLKEQTDALMERKRNHRILAARSGRSGALADRTGQADARGGLPPLAEAGRAAHSSGGYAQSSARVSTLMRNIEASPWLEKPQLLEIKAVTGRQAASQRVQHERLAEADCR